MRPYVVLAAAWLLLSCAGCASWSQSKVKPKPVTFNHPDEVIRGEGFMALADRRIFTAMAFANAAGYDDEQPGIAMHPVRVKVREELAKRLADKPEKLQAYRTYCKNVVVGNVRIFGYKSYVLALSADYPFRRIRADHELGYPFTALALRDLPQILNEFWIMADLDDLWEQVKPEYLAEIREYDLNKMQREMVFLWEYLRMTRHDPSTVIVEVPDLLDHHWTSTGAGYEHYFYSVNTPEASGYGFAVHEYLHGIVNSLIEADYPRFEAKLQAYYEAGQDAPAVANYRQPVTFTFECLVRALDRRIRRRFENTPQWTKLMEDQVANDTRKGLNLTQPFYDLLDAFERSGQPFDQYLPTLLERLPEYRGSRK